MNKKTRKIKNKNIKNKNKKYKKNKYKYRTKKKEKKKKKYIKQTGEMNFLFPNICSKEEIEKKYKIVFVKNQIGGENNETGGENNETKVGITPESCKIKIKDLETQYNKYVNEWKKHLIKL